MSRFVAHQFDILPDDYDYFQKIEETLENIASSFGFKKIHTSFLDDRDFYEKFLEKSERPLSPDNSSILRPDGIISLIRAYLDHHPFSDFSHPLKLYFLGPVFQPYEQHQFGIEIIGTNSDLSDAFLIGLLDSFYKKVGLDNLVFTVNSIGCQHCQTTIKKRLAQFFENNQQHLCLDCFNLVHKNPLLIPLCQNESCEGKYLPYPPFVDYLCENCKENLKNILEYLDDLNIVYDFNPRFMKRKKYQEKIIFEVREKNNKQTFGNGGRHDHLLNVATGKGFGATGFFGFIAPLITEIKRKSNAKRGEKIEISLIHLGNLAEKKILNILFYLHNAGFKITTTLDKMPLKAQLENAAKKKIPISLILGQKEAQDDSIIVRNMLDGSQETVELKQLVSVLKKCLHNVVNIKKSE